MALTKKQEAFVQEYLIDLNATQAAIRAGYSEKTAENIGWENVRKPQIAEAIQEAMQKRAQKTSITAENVLQDILDTRDRLKDLMAYTDDDGVEHVNTNAVNGRLKANEMLGKHLKLFTERTENVNLNRDLTEDEADEVLKSFGIDPDSVK